MEQVMLVGPWRIKLVPIMLKVWKTNKPMKKDSASVLPLWIKMHNVPIVAYTHVGLNLITSKVGRLIRYESHTNNICLNSWGHSSYARALVEVSADSPLVDSVVATIPLDIEEEQPQEAKRSSFDDNDDVVAPACGKGIRFTEPKTKLVYRAVQKMPNVDQTKTDSAKSYEDTNNVKSPIDSTDPGFHSDDIDLGELKRFVDQRMEEDKILDINSNSGNNGCISECMDDNIAASKVSTSSVNSGTRCDADAKDSFGKSSYTMEVMNANSETDEDVVSLPDARSSRPSTSFGGGHQLEKGGF
ncbi:zinc knuckle CX2CX4HX4C containing protein [Tanacetum coccineum]